MFRETTDYLTRPARSARRLRAKGVHLARQAPAPAKESLSAATVAGVAALALAVGLGYYFGPDLVRYLKLRRM